MATKVSAENIEQFFLAIPKLKCLVIGDVMIDEYIWGTAERISPEAPVPVVKFAKREQRLGGAGNVALNIKAMGAEVMLCSLIGNDDAGQKLEVILAQSDISSIGLKVSKHRPTTIKTRVLAGNQHLLRIDSEIDTEPADSEKASFTNHCISQIASFNPDIVIFEDYDKGTIYKELISEVMKACKTKNILVAVDPKFRNFFEYNGSNLFKPNFKELVEATNFFGIQKTSESVEKCLTKFEQESFAALYLVTLSEKGVYFKTPSERNTLPAHIRKISDVSGAGDTVIAVASLALAAKMSSSFIAFISNLAGGIVCEEVGVVPINLEKLKQEASLEMINKS